MNDLRKNLHSWRYSVALEQLEYARHTMWSVDLHVARNRAVGHAAQ